MDRFTMEQQKLQQEKVSQLCGQAATTKVPYPTTAGCDIAQDCVANAEPLIYRLMRNMNASEHEARKQRRAVEILERHPEFEELIELLRLVPIW
jgi:hypothetical protein